MYMNEGAIFVPLLDNKHLCMREYLNIIEKLCRVIRNIYLFGSKPEYFGGHLN